LVQPLDLKGAIDSLLSYPTLSRAFRLKMASNEAQTLEVRARQGIVETRAGLVYGVSAYTLWGVFPLYFKLLAAVSPWVVLCHRIVWSALFMGLVVSFRCDWGAVSAVLRSVRQLALLSCAAVLLALNWLIFIYAVASKQTLQASLGYFINPLLSVALGVLLLGERLRVWQWVAVGIAVVAVGNLALRDHSLPWIAVSLAITFGFYGLVRKKADANALHALLIESLVLLVPAGIALVTMPNASVTRRDFAILSMSGVITAVPLIMFGAAVRRLKLSTIGFLQYIGPTLQFLVAVVVFKEHMDRVRLLSFALCWVGIAVYVADSILHQQAQTAVEEPD
jgi:chloramphenicol-sensitive protein RarD